MIPPEARAVWFPAPRRAELRYERLDPPGPEEITVRTVASAISPGTEMLVYRGEAPADLPLDLPTLSGSYALPVKYGYAASGRVERAGERVRELSPGDTVFVHHPHQDRFTVPAHLAVRLPDGIPPERGTFFANLETALGVVHDAAPRLGEDVVVFGCGVVGLLILRLLGLCGVGSLLAVDPLERRRELALRFGASAAVEPGAVGEAVAGRGADVVVEASGSAAALPEALGCVRREGTVVVASWYGTKPVTLDLGGRFHRGRVRIRSSQVGGIAPELSARWDRERRRRVVLDLLRRLPLEEMVTHRIPFERAPEAYRLVDEVPSEVLQVILTYPQGGG
ncbi:alcohol dehydrogenase [Rubrobacter xylanophilus]|uniref:Alcohol dehydrogenase n=1 Tax=Rubrobacter xylanophilus TaxID=49319 RepID=A0A510HIU7_9ACTN|nr:zinc-binding alcohol dehydrogenase [Rubrobacter xylanophilus]BBL79910.1 alcohol dehydrogenase [Rubrobacter xylanophilus]